MLPIFQHLRIESDRTELLTLVLGGGNKPVIKYLL